MRRVAVVGDANVDIVVHFPVFQDEGHRQVEWPSPEMVGGGTSSNTAAALGGLSVPCYFVGTVGDDANGRFVRDDLLNHGVDTGGLICDPELNTVEVFAFVDESGERYLWGWPRHDQSFKEIDESKVDFSMIRSAGWVHTSGMSLVYDTSARKTITRILSEAHGAGIPTSLDLNLRVDDGTLDPDFAEALQAVMHDVSFLLGSGPDEFSYMGDGSWMENARRLATDGRTVIARDGACGSMAFCGSESVSVPAYVVDVEDTIGAGDVYNAGFIAAILRGLSLEEALRRANAVAGYSVSRTGARDTPDLAELDKFMSTNKTR